MYYNQFTKPQLWKKYKTLCKNLKFNVCLSYNISTKYIIIKHLNYLNNHSRHSIKFYKNIKSKCIECKYSNSINCNLHYFNKLICNSILLDIPYELTFLIKSFLPSRNKLKLYLDTVILKDDIKKKIKSEKLKLKKKCDSQRDEHNKLIKKIKKNKYDFRYLENINQNNIIHLSRFIYSYYVNKILKINNIDNLYIYISSKQFLLNGFKNLGYPTLYELESKFFSSNFIILNIIDNLKLYNKSFYYAFEFNENFILYKFTKEYLFEKEKERKLKSKMIRIKKEKRKKIKIKKTKKKKTTIF